MRIKLYLLTNNSIPMNSQNKNQLIFWILITGVLLTLFRFDVVIFGVAFLIMLLLLTNRAFAWTPLPESSRRYSLGTVLIGYALTMAIMLTTGVSYPFFQQGSSYARLSATTARQRNGVKGS